MTSSSSFRLFVLSLLPLLVTALFDEDLIIERRPHHVDWEDLFMEYNRYSAPDHLNQHVNVSVELVSVRNDRVILELNQHWRDQRLRFVGVARVPVPSHILPWQPDTYIRNGLDVVVEQRSLSLNYDGTFLLRQKIQTTANLDEQTRDLTLVISSLSNYGTDLIQYAVVESKVDDSSDYRMTFKQKMRKFDGLLFEDVVVTIHSSQAVSIISNVTNF